MLSLKERFARWEGEKASLMKKHINTALLYIPYMDSKEDFDSLKRDLITESESYQQLNLNKSKEAGALLYCKLRLEEYIDQLVGKQAPEEKELIELNKVLEEVFNSPYSNPTKQLKKVTHGIKLILKLDMEQISDKKLMKDILLDLYMVMCLMLKMLENLNPLLKWFIEKYLDLNELNKIIKNVTPLLENQIKKIDKFIGLKQALPEAIDLSEALKLDLSVLHRYFQQEFTYLKNPNSLKKDFFELFNKKMLEVKEQITQLIQSKDKKEFLSRNQIRIQHFINAILEEKVPNQQNLFALINSHSQAFYLLMEQVSDQEKKDLLTQINSLKPQSTVKIWMEHLTPQWLQNTLSLKWGVTEKESYEHLKIIAEKYAFQIAQESQLIDEKIFSNQNQLFDKHENEVIDKAYLESMLQVIESADKAIKEFNAVSNFLFGAVWHLQLIRESNEVLDNFIMTHNSFIIKLFSYLAEFFDLFKTQTVLAINKTREIKKHLAFWKFDYQKELEKELNSILKNPNIHQELKNELQKQIQDEMKTKIKILQGPYRNRKEVSGLITNLEGLYFNKKKVSILEPSLKETQKSFKL